LHLHHQRRYHLISGLTQQYEQKLQTQQNKLTNDRGQQQLSEPGKRCKRKRQNELKWQQRKL
jgi:hypothetical protein